MSKNMADPTPSSASSTTSSRPRATAGGGAVPPVGTARRAAPPRRPAQSVRLAREARQQRLWYSILFAVVALIVLTLIGGALWEYVIYPGQAIATVNGQSIRTDSFNRFQKFETTLLTNQSSQLQAQIYQLQADTKNAAANAQLIQQLQTQQTTVAGNQQNVPAYTLSQMEQALELQQAARKIGAQATTAQLDAQMATLRKQSGYASLVSGTGVQDGDIRTYFATPAVVQQNVTKHYQGTVAKTEPEAKARHILVTAQNKTLADNLAAAIKANNGATFGALAQKYSIDNGTNGTQISKLPKAQQAQALAAQKQSSAYNGGWLRDPSQPFVSNQPSWLTPQTQFVPEVLNAVLSMKPGEVRVVKSQYGYHVIQVTARATHTLTTAERDAILQQNGQKGYQAWFTSATDATKNRVSPPDPNAQFPPATPVGQ